MRTSTTGLSFVPTRPAVWQNPTAARDEPQPAATQAKPRSLRKLAFTALAAGAPLLGLGAALPQAVAAQTVMVEPSQPQFGEFKPKQVSSVGAFTLSHEARQALLQSVPTPGSPAGQKLLALMNQVYVSHPATPPAPAKDPGLLHVVSWNINDPDDAERISAVLQGHPEALGANADAQAAQELTHVANADVYNLQEVNLPVAQALADKLNMHLVWAPEFIDLGAAGQNTEPGHGFTGNAILSRYALSDPTVIRYHQQSDWYKDEAKGVPKIEQGIRAVGRHGFGVDIPDHEIRVPAPFGGRIALSADVDVPGGKRLTSVDIHLENHAKPEVRRQQMDEVIDFIAAHHNPVFFGGDFNTTGKDGRIQTTGRFIKGQFDTPGKVIDKAASVGFHFVPYAGWGKDGYEAYKMVKSHNDPTSVTNPEHLLFRDVEHNLGVKPTDERAKLGYKHTWAMPHQHGVGNSILDWTFLYHPGDTDLQVVGAHTYEHMVQKTAGPGEERISDHNALTNDIRLGSQP
ncbi:MAG TPA: endonuclease/exonuclease/phosphatase family protein [Candidatus Xenobia bacterium]